MSVESEPGSAIILAAGYSRRFGSDKRVTPFGSGTLLSHTCSCYVDVFDRVIVVLRPNETCLASSLPKSVEMAVSENAKAGMSQSLMAGVRAAGSSPWIVIALGDMPCVEQTTLQLLRSALENSDDQVVRLKHGDKFGNPVGFPSKYYRHLMSLSGDKGAKHLFNSGLLECTVLTVDDLGILIDFDLSGDFEVHFNQVSDIHQ
ncbi:MAG: nucleotidyltransferase family protein [Gammaproteobacteria bacterium]|nr:nucleotidyltransferase family protein [Gammaproteobacteria bacterium]